MTEILNLHNNKRQTRGLKMVKKEKGDCVIKYTNGGDKNGRDRTDT